MCSYWSFASDLHQVYRGVSIPAWCSQSFAQVTHFSFSFWEKIIWPHNNFLKMLGIRNFIICVWQLRCFKNELRLWKRGCECTKDTKAGFPGTLGQVWKWHCHHHHHHHQWWFTININQNWTYRWRNLSKSVNISRDGDKFNCRGCNGGYVSQR